MYNTSIGNKWATRTDLARRLDMQYQGLFVSEFISFLNMVVRFNCAFT
jgi:hypothetical protein